MLPVKTLFLALSLAAFTNAAAIIDVSHRGSVPDITDLTTDVIDDSGLYDVSHRGSVPDVTDLDADIIPDSAVPVIERRQTATTDTLLFSSSISTFLSAKARRSPSTLNWTDDGCSNSPDKPSGFNFLPSCQRHDFGYRNYKAQARFTDSNRKRIDDNFKNDLYNECNKYTGLESFKGVACRRIADTYYVAVRTFGGL